MAPGKTGGNSSIRPVLAVVAVVSTMLLVVGCVRPKDEVLGTGAATQTGAVARAPSATATAREATAVPEDTA
ncbi:MAG TPA: hypothetical protein VER55_01630, partial [Ardenticatenaceae bacterium]|nr:hypothetical protein [Ardenticatenaceae bacterium]